MTVTDRRRALFDCYGGAAVIVSGTRADQLGREQAPPPGGDSPHVELADAPGLVRSAGGRRQGPE